MFSSIVHAYSKTVSHKDIKLFLHVKLRGKKWGKRKISGLENASAVENSKVKGLKINEYRQIIEVRI
jgi:hypothetical protein